MLWSPVLLLAFTGMQAPVPLRASAVLLPLILLALVLPKIGHRRRDALLLLVPIRAISFSWNVSRRLADLPHPGRPVPDTQP